MSSMYPAWHGYQRYPGRAAQSPGLRSVTQVGMQVRVIWVMRRTSGRESSWWLAGSTALAVRGARIEPGDIDLVCSGDGALGLGLIFADAIIEPVVHDASSPISDYWGPRVPGCPARMDRCSQGWRRLPFAIRLRARRRVPA